MTTAELLRELAGQRSVLGLLVSDAVYDPAIVSEVAATCGIRAIPERGGVRLQLGEIAPEALDEALDMMLRQTVESGFIP